MIMMALILILLIYDAVQACKEYFNKKKNKKAKKEEESKSNESGSKSVADSTFLQGIEEEDLMVPTPRTRKISKGKFAKKVKKGIDSDAVFTDLRAA